MMINPLNTLSMIGQFHQQQQSLFGNMLNPQGVSNQSMFGQGHINSPLNSVMYMGNPVNLPSLIQQPNEPLSLINPQNN